MKRKNMSVVSINESTSSRFDGHPRIKNKKRPLFHLTDSIFKNIKCPHSSSTKSYKFRADADHCKDKIILFINGLIPGVVLANHNKNVEQVKNLWKNFRQLLDEAIQKETWAQFYGEYRSRHNVSIVLDPPAEIFQISDYVASINAVVDRYIKAINICGYALSLYLKRVRWLKEKTIKRPYHVAAQDKLILEMRKQAINAEKQAVKCTATVIQACETFRNSCHCIPPKKITRERRK